MALLVITFRGSSAEGQTSFLSTWLSGYVEEKAIAWDSSHVMAGAQYAEVGGAFTGVGGDDSSSPTSSPDTPTVQESAMLAVNPPDGGYLDAISGSRSQVLQYTVQQGDLLSFIASDYGVSINSILWANGLKDPDSISPGQILRIPPVDGVIYQTKKGDTVSLLAKRYGADADRIIAYNRLPQDGALNAGLEIMIPDGSMPRGTIASTVAKVVTTAVKKGVVFALSEAAIDTPRIPLIGTASAARLAKYASVFDHLPDLDEYFKAPAVGFDWGLIHGRNGVDVANSCGTAIYAAAEGTVTVADASGYNGGFGKYIKIVHPNGTETLYAHASKLLIQEGQAVAKGDKIALMGATGNATGCHLHFEVHGAHNPLAKE